jgi:hypothetical protein
MSGVGKTFICGTAENWEGSSPCLFIDVEGGALTLHDVVPNVDVVRPTNWAELQNVYNFLRNENTKYKSVVIDSLTEVQRAISMAGILGDVDDGGTYSDLERSNPPNRADWLRTSEQLRKFIRAYRDLSYLKDEKRRLHVIFTALEKYDEKKETVCVQLPGALGLEAGAYVDILGRLSIVETVDPETSAKVTKRHLLVSEYTSEDGTKFLAKNRGGRLGTSMWNPTVRDLIGVWSEDRPTKERPTVEPIPSPPKVKVPVSGEVSDKIE